MDARFSAHYQALRRMARARLRHHETFTLLGTTDLVHESFLRLVKGAGLNSEEERSFLAYVGRVMKSVIVDAARSRLTQRRGEGEKPESLDDEAVELVDAGPAKVIVDLSDAVAALRKSDPRLADVIDLQYFAGMSEPEVAAALGVSERTVRRDIARARLVLKALLA